MKRSSRKQHFVYARKKETHRGKCGKVIYVLKKDAKSAWRSLSRNKEKRDKIGELVIYYCSSCSGYHVGHNQGDDT
jgi:hypothetical protein